MGLLFLLMNLAWILFGWACVQEAVREGVRSAVTCASAGGITAGADSVVVQYSFGFLNSQNVATYTTVSFYSPSLVPLKSTDLVTSGTVVKVSVKRLTAHHVCRDSPQSDTDPIERYVRGHYGLLGTAKQ